MNKYRNIRNILSVISIIENKTIYESCLLAFIIMETGFSDRMINTCSLQEALTDDGRMMIINEPVKTLLSTYLSSRMIRYYNIYQNFNFLNNDLEELLKELSPLIRGISLRHLQNEWIKAAFKMGLNVTEILESTKLTPADVSKYTATKSPLLVRNAVGHYIANLG